ncbi:MAG: glutamine-hydrolyzing carbamoyl-phosphate synthase small subunit [Lachnospiraceae bacterium]|nr:glutamine-hydrolyzing carbamoyl-phosphate synthase small subunit [Lachnospiraceae bacterium]
MENRLRKKILLEDGSEYAGYSFGSKENKMVELVFNTSMVGYQEIISDPSYTYQSVVMTYPLIGNYGMCDEDYETLVPTISGMVVKEYCDEPSNFRYKNTLAEIMEKYGVVGLEGVDTRKLARHIRNFGSCKAYIVDESVDSSKALEELKAWVPATDAVSKVSTKTVRVVEANPTDSEKYPLNRVVAIDCGMKENIVRELSKHGCQVTVVPYNTSAEDILKYGPDGVFISNGPGDPESCVETIEAIKNLIGKVPIFGICLGHQIISLAYGAKTYKLKFGHRGGNHPVKNLKTGKIEITSQNHSFAVKEETLAGTGLEMTHINLLDNTIEGVECVKDKVFSVQYHPESAPGPEDSSYLFDVFIKNMKENKEGK